MRSLLHIALCLLALVAAVGCSTSNSVRLAYAPVKEGADACTKSITVQRFEDARESDALGPKADGTKFYPSSSVADWVSKALYDELEQAGCMMAYHEAEYRPVTDYTVTGTITKVHLAEVSATQYEVELAMDVVMARNDEAVYRESVVSQISKRVVPGKKNPGEILSEGLQELLRPVTAKILARMQ